MYIPFNEIDGSARVWIYPADRSFSVEETEVLRSRIQQFATNWLSHQRPVQGTGEVIELRFIVLAANESFTDVSGCSIDSSVKFIRELEAEIGVNLFDRTQMYFQDSEKAVQAIDFRKIQEAFDSGLIQENTPVFSLQINEMNTFRNGFSSPFKATPYARFVKQTV